MTDFCIETKRLYIRKLEDCDFEFVKQIYDEDSFVEAQKDSPLFYDCLIKTHWKAVTVFNTLNGMIFEKATNDFCGRVCMQYTDSDVPEIGIELLVQKQNKGIGPEAIVAFANWYHREHGTKTVYVRIEEDNMHSRHVFESLGAVYKGKVPYVSESVINKIEDIFPDFNKEEVLQERVPLFTLELPLP